MQDRTQVEIQLQMAYDVLAGDHSNPHLQPATWTPLDSAPSPPIRTVARMNRPDWPKNVICLGTDWYSPLESSVRQIVSEFRHRGCRVLWINPIPIRFPNMRRPDVRRKVANKVRTQSRLLRHPAPGVFVYSPIYLPLFTPAGMRLNRIAVSFQVAVLQSVLWFRTPLVIASEFTAWYAMPAIHHHRFFFHVADKISAFREVANQADKRARLESMEAEIVRHADVAGCSSRLIYQHVVEVDKAQKGQPERILYLPHAIDARVFAAAADQPDPEDIAALPRPIAGYYGSLTQTNDKATFLHAAKSLPEWTFVFIGKIAGDYDELAAQPNVRFMGPRPHKDIPRYGRCFDVCFMGWLEHEWITNSFPLKTVEYLTLGKPIVSSSRINEISQSFPGLIRFTDNADDFVRALVEERQMDTTERERARRTATAQFTWQHYVDTVLAAFAPSGKGGAS